MIADLKPYPAMKDSGVSWLGELPEHWEVRRLKHVCRLAYGDALASEIRQNGTVPVYGSNGRVGFHSAANTKAPCVVIGRKGSFGKVNFSSHPLFAIDTTFFVDSRFSSADVRWLYFLLGWLQLDEVSKDAAVPGLDREDAYQRVAAVPPLPEQAAIVRFLDHADRRIRRYIRAKQKLVKLLEEQKQAIIHRAVTRGLDPNVRLKPSGVEWLGDVPNHWEVLKLKQVTTKIEQGWSPQCDAQRSADDEWGVLKVGCVNRAALDPDQNKKLPAALHPMLVADLEIQDGDILVSRANTRELLGLAALAVRPRARLLLCDKLFRFRALENRANPQFLVHAIRGRNSRHQIESRTNGASDSMQNIGQGVVQNLAIALPPLPEQDRIVEALAAETAALGIGISHAQREIELLREYRTRLIADVVTGKLDVREAAARLPEEVEESEPLDGTEVVAEGEDEPAEDLDAVPDAAEA